MKITNININKLKRNKYKICLMSLVGVLTLSGCNANNNSTTLEEQNYPKHSVNVVFDNKEYSEETDRLVFYSDDGELYGGVSWDDIDSSNFKLPENCNCYSNVLDSSKKLPEINSDEEYIITVDYLNDTINITTKNINNLKTK